MRWSLLFACLVLTSTPSILLAGEVSARPEDWWRSWNPDSLVLLNMGVLGWVYVRGVRRLRKRAANSAKIASWQVASFLASLIVVLLALLSPLDALGEALASLHMIQHMILIGIAAPLFVLGAPGFVLAWGLPELWTVKRPTTMRLVFWLPNARIAWQPLLIALVFAVTLWAWHHPLLYQAALRDPLVHDAQHLSFFLAACLFWRVVLDPLSTRRLNPVTAVPYLFATSLHASALGIFLTFSPRVWYAHYLATTPAWGLSPLADQQLAGLIMWMPACLVFPLAAAVLVGRWLAAPPQPRSDVPRLPSHPGLAIRG